MVVVEIDLGIGEVRQDVDVVLFRKRHQVAVEIERGDRGGRVRRIADDDGDGFRDRVLDRAFGGAEKFLVGLDRHRADHAARHQEAEGVDRIGRIGRENHIARRGDRLGHVGEAFLGAERRDDLAVGVELHPEAALVIAGLGAAQAGDALGGGIAVGARLARRLDQFIDDMARRRQIGIAHAEVDDVGAGGAGLGLQTIDLFEHIGRQPPHAIKIAHPFRPRFVIGRRCAGNRGD